MNGFVAVTDFAWFQFLCSQTELDEVNFWRPSDTRTPRQLVNGAPVIFKLRKQYGGRIVGFGNFVLHRVLPAWLAWESFGPKNGAGSFPQLLDQIGRLRARGGDPSPAQPGDFKIGCLMLSQPVFFEEEDWVRPPDDWPENVVQGKGYPLETGEGARIWQECLLRATSYTMSREGFNTHRLPSPRYGEGALVKPRFGQGTFRIAVTEAYQSACAVTSEHSLPALEAAHIRPYGEGGEHELANGLLLRSDIHRLFDRGYVGVTPEGRFVVSARLKDDYSNGRSYYPLHGQPIRLPLRADERPDSRILEWHMRERFRG
jgi:putative restriction endonuclease